jgi:heme-degrading monooxygenase HmoA
MIVTTLDSMVSADKWDELKAGFKKMVEAAPGQIVQSLLVQNSHDLTSWKVITIWKSKEAFIEYRKSVQTPVPEGVALFRSVGAEPVASLFSVSEFSKINS